MNPSITQYHNQRVVYLWVVGLSLAFTIFLFFWVRGWERVQVEKEFQYDATIYTTLFQRSMERNLDMIDSLGGYFSSEISIHGIDDIYMEFVNIVQHPLENHPEIQMLALAPRVKEANRIPFEKKARVQGMSGFQITEHKKSGEMVPARNRAEYFPVYFLEPLHNNKAMAGFDLASETIHRTAIEQARDSGTTVITGRIKIEQGSSKTFTFIMFHPIYHVKSPLETVAQRRDALVGLTLGIFHIRDIVEIAFHDAIPSGIDFYLFDESSPLKNAFFIFIPHPPVMHHVIPRKPNGR